MNEHYDRQMTEFQTCLQAAREWTFETAALKADVKAICPGR